MSAKTIVLSKPIEMHGDIIKEIKLKEPTGSQYLSYGEPRILARNSDATVYWVEDRVSIRSYLDVCIDHEMGSHLIPLLTLADVRRAKDAILSFFTEADQEIFAS